MIDIDAIARHGVDLPMPPPQRAARQHGVYLLVRNGRVVCVGVTLQIEMRLPALFHGAGRTPPKKFDRAIWLPLARGDLPAYAGALVRSLRPVLNDRTPAPCGRDHEILERLGLPPHDEATAHAEVRRAQIKARAKRARS